MLLPCDSHWMFRWPSLACQSFALSLHKACDGEHRSSRGTHLGWSHIDSQWLFFHVGMLHLQANEGEVEDARLARSGRSYKNQCDPQEG